MKLASLGLALTVLGSSVFAQAGLLAKACYADGDRRNGPYVTQVEIYSDEVLVNYTKPGGQGLGGYRGRIFGKAVVSSGVVSVSNVTLKEGMDGFIDDANIVITKSTVTFDSKASKEGPKARVACLDK